MQKQEIPSFTLCHSGCDLALNQLGVLQAISRPPQRLNKCSLNSNGPVGPLCTDFTWRVAAATVHANTSVISRRANSRAARVRLLCFLCSAASCLIHEGSSCGWSGGLRSTGWVLRSFPIILPLHCNLSGDSSLLWRCLKASPVIVWMYSDH